MTKNVKDMCANHTLFQYNKIKNKEIKNSRTPARTEFDCRKKLEKMQREKQLDSKNVWEGFDRSEPKRFGGV